MAQISNITCYKGEAVVVAVTMSPVVDISGWTISFTLKASAGSTAPLVTKAGIVVNGPAGTFRVPLASGDTNLQPQAYAYDIWRTDAGTETVLSLGTFNILQEVR